MNTRIALGTLCVALAFAACATLEPAHHPATPQAHDAGMGPMMGGKSMMHENGMMGGMADGGMMAGGHMMMDDGGCAMMDGGSMMMGKGGGMAPMTGAGPTGPHDDHAH